jgi:hypothetical protein
VSQQFGSGQKSSHDLQYYNRVCADFEDNYAAEEIGSTSPQECGGNVHWGYIALQKSYFCIGVREHGKRRFSDGRTYPLQNDIAKQLSCHGNNLNPGYSCHFKQLHVADQLPESPEICRLMRQTLTLFSSWSVINCNDDLAYNAHSHLMLRQ